jgi:hypothetical protein
MRYQLTLFALLPLVYGSPIAELEDRDQSITFNVTQPAPTTLSLWDAVPTDNTDFKDIDIGIDSEKRGLIDPRGAKKTTKKETKNTKIKAAATKATNTKATAKATTTKATSSKTTTKATATKATSTKGTTNKVTSFKASSTKSSATKSSSKASSSKAGSKSSSSSLNSSSSQASTSKASSRSSSLATPTVSSFKVSSTKAASSKASYSKASSRSSSSATPTPSSSKAAEPIACAVPKVLSKSGGSTRRWLSEFVRRLGQPSQLGRPTTTTVAALREWTRRLYQSGNPRQVSVNFDRPEDAEDLKATSRFESFGDDPFYMTLTEIYGCTGLVVTSQCGAYIAHFWQNAVADVENSRALRPGKEILQVAVTETLNGGRNLGLESALSAKEKANRDKTTHPEGQTYQTLKLVPDAGNFVGLSQHKDCFSKDKGAKAAVFSVGDGSGPKYPMTSRIIADEVSKITKIARTDIRIYGYAKKADRFAKSPEEPYGKILLTYSPKTGTSNAEHGYEVYAAMTKESDTTLALDDSWTTNPQTCQCNAQTLRDVTKNPKPTYDQKQRECPGCCLM